MYTIPMDTKLALEIQIGKLLKEKKKTLAVAESCTGGLVGSRITDVSGSSGYFVGGIIAYSNDMKISILDVSPEDIDEYGVVSEHVALTMAEGVICALDADVAVSITGIAGPGGGSEEKPVGLAYIGFAGGDVVRTKKVVFEGDRVSLKQQFTEAVLEFLLENL